MALTISGDVDLVKLRKDAEAAGFNPFGLIRAGLGAAYARQYEGEPITTTPSFTGGGGEVPSNPIPPAIAVQPWEAPEGDALQPGWEGKYLSSLPESERGAAMAEMGSSEDTYQGADDDTFLKIEIAQMKMRYPGITITDQGRVVDTRPAAPPRTYAGAATQRTGGNPSVGTPATPPRPASRQPQQQSGGWGLPDWWPNSGSAGKPSDRDPTGPGFYWETIPDYWPAQDNEDEQGEVSPMSIVKILDETGLNIRRAWDHNMPTLRKTIDWFSSNYQAPPTVEPYSRTLGTGGWYATGGSF